MHDCCATCGAMYISYGLALAFIFIVGAALWGLADLRMDKAAIAG